MTRKALLIGGIYGKPLSGVSRDIVEWEAFLQSSIGGCWLPGEIEDLSGLAHDQILAKVKDATNVDYTVVAFSGHGHECVYPAPYPSVVKICLNEIENDVSASTFIPTKCATVIFDCCRGVDDVSTSVANESFTCDSAIVKNAFQFRTCGNNRVLESVAFKRELQLKRNCPTVVMYSCSRDESAEEDPNAGGVYTSLLLRGA